MAAKRRKSTKIKFQQHAIPCDAVFVTSDQMAGDLVSRLFFRQLRDLPPADLLDLITSILKEATRR
jgi:hypothetical protein